uniref:RING-type domain-containing protein n=1 Tax=Kalanchoe fedtschenkoi TaxID=63787 RepID=A0A7N0V5G8_KALFE
MNGDEKETSESSPLRLDLDPCPICLRPVNEEAFLDECFHKFCYSCIAQWMKIVSGKSKSSHQPSTLRCPMCKRESSCIIHSYDGRSFKKHYVNDCYEDRSFFSSSHKQRLQCYYSEPGSFEDVIDVLRYWKFNKYSQPSRWLEGWMTREIQALLQEEDVEIIVHHILGVIDSFSKRGEEQRRRQTSAPEAKRSEFKTLVSNAARPFLTARTDRFVHELELFLASGLSIQGYDEVYLQHMSQKAEEQPQSSTAPIPFLHIFDDDSDGPG